MDKRNAEPFTDEQLSKIVEMILSGETYIKKIARENGIPNSTLSLTIHRYMQKNNPENYEEFKRKMTQNKKSGGTINKDKEPEKAEKVKIFYLTYLVYKKDSKSNNEIIKKMHISKKLFYANMKRLHKYIEEGEIEFAKEQFQILEANIKEEVLIRKARNRDKALGKRERSNDEYKKRMTDFIEYIKQREEGENNLDVDTIYGVIYNNIDLIRLSLEKKIKSTIECLDKRIGIQLTNTMLANKPFMFSFAQERVEELVEIADSHGRLNEYARSSDRSSPKLLHALLEYAHDNEVEFKNINQILKDAGRHGIKKEYLLKSYPYTKKTRDGQGPEITE